MIEKLIVLEDIDPVIFYGVNNANIQLIKALYPKLRIVARGNVIKVLGDEEEMCAFEENITKLEKYCAEYNSLKEEVIIDIIKGNAPQAEQTGNVIVFSVTGKPINDAVIFTTNNANIQSKKAEIHSKQYSFFLYQLIVLEDIDPVIFYGVNNANIQLIKALYPKLRIVARGNVIKVLGDEEEMCAFEENITKLEKYCAEYNSLKEEVIIDIIKGNAPQAEQTGNVIVFSVTGKPIIPRSENQLKLVEGFAKNDMVFAIGPAGSGKTYTAIALAVRALKNKEIKKIILSRPAVEAGEKLGFLPGDMKDKIDPYLQPLYDALQDMIPAAKLKEYMELNIIQIAPLAFMRGRTLNDAVVILDEAQNTTTQQIKMFLTRMGMNTKMIVTGDMTQIDLPASQTSGLVQALRILKGVKGISFVELNKKDIVRHKLVERIVDAYEKFDKEAKAEREKRKNEQLVINGERPVKLAKD